MSYAPRILDKNTNKAVSVGTGSTKILGKNEKRGYVTVVNDSDTVIYLAFGEEATLNSGIRLNPLGGSLEIGGGGDNYFDEVYAICATGGKVLVVTELNTR